MGHAAGQIVVREAGGIVSGIAGDDDPLKTGNVICGNEIRHAELVKILKRWRSSGGLRNAFGQPPHASRVARSLSPTCPVKPMTACTATHDDDNRVSFSASPRRGHLP